MKKREIMATTVGEMLTMINCNTIYKGRARQKQKQRFYSYDEAINLR